MARMFIGCQDWSFDLFKGDSELYKATPRKGVYPRSSASYREYFMVTLKGYVRDFIEEWNKKHEGRWYDRRDGYIGDAFAHQDMFRNGFFSDFYKDAYNQRPHLNIWFYINSLGLPMSEDTTRTLCARPIEDAVNNAQYIRKQFESEVC